MSRYLPMFLGLGWWFVDTLIGSLVSEGFLDLAMPPLIELSGTTSLVPPHAWRSAVHERVSALCKEPRPRGVAARRPAVG